MCTSKSYFKVLLLTVVLYISHDFSANATYDFSANTTYDIRAAVRKAHEQIGRHGFHSFEIYLIFRI